MTLGTALFACGNGGSSDAGSDTGSGSDSSGNQDSSDDQGSCMPMLCVHGDQPMQCPSCSPSNGDICSPPANVMCNYTNGCSGAKLSASMCTCALPDAGADGGDAGSTWYWTCKLGV